MMDADERKALRAKASAIIRNEGDVRAYSIAVSPAMRDFLALGLPSVVVELLDALEAAEADQVLSVPREPAGPPFADFGGTTYAADIAKLRAERDELAAEVAAYQGRPEGALPGWEWRAFEWVCRSGVEYAGPRAPFSADEKLYVVLRVIGGSWAVNACREGWLSPDKCICYGREATPRAAMHAAEAAARARGLL